LVISFAGHGMQVPEYPQWKGIEPNGVNEQIAFSGYSFSGAGAREIVVNKEVRAWLSRLDQKGVDVLVIMDSCFGGGMTRSVDPRNGGFTVRAISGDVAKGDREKFAPIQMTEKEARTEVRGLSHVTFLAGATANTVVPETIGLNPAISKAPRGALSFFAARAIEGAIAKAGDLTREQLFQYVGQNVRQVTSERQIIDIEPRSEDEKVLQRAVIRTSGSAISGVNESTAIQAKLTLGDPVRVFVTGGSPNALATMEKGRAPFVAATRPEEADLVWDISNSKALSHGDAVMDGVDGSLLGGVIDRTWTIRNIQTLSAPRVLSVRLRDEGKRYVPGETPEIAVSGVHGRYLTAFNIAADGEVQMLFPVSGRNNLIEDGEWSYRPVVEKPFGADHVVAVATERASADFVKWLIEHNHKRDAALVPGEITRLIQTDATARIGTVGLYTSASRD
jgi:hypothetical protein